MQKYKITASKSQKKYTFVLSAENEKLAKQRIHKDGYSILAVELFDENNISRNTFIFEAEKSWEIKKWKVVWDDIFKIYLKLRDWVWYKVLKLYSKQDENKIEEYKINAIKDLEEKYFFYKNNTKKWKKSSQKKEIKQWKNEVNIDNFYLKKQLEETYNLIDFTLNKLKKLLEKTEYNLDEYKKEKLKNLYNSLVKIKSSTNISKLKEVWEKVLLKIWEIELDYLEKNKDKESQNQLSETNKLLKQIWSDKKFIEKDKDIVKQLQKIWQEIKEFFENFFKKDKKENNIWLKNKDKSSNEYLKTRLFLNKYKQKLSENNKEILKNCCVFVFPFWKNEEKRDLILLKRSVLKQNIYLFKAKLEGKTFSYTKTLKGFAFIMDSIFEFFKYIKDYLFYVVLFYSILFLIFLNLDYYWISSLETSLNYNWIFYFIMFIFLYFAIYFSRWVYTLIINLIFLFFIFNFWIINF